MNASKTVQINAATQVVEKTTFTAAADVNGSLSGKKLTCTNAAGVKCNYIYQVAGYTWSAAVQTTVKTSVTEQYYIVSIPANETAVNIATATRAVVNNFSKLNDQKASGTTTAIIIENRRGGVAGTASTTDTGFTNVRTQTGTTVLTQDAGASASTGVKFQYFPPQTNKLYMDVLGLTFGTKVTTTAGVDLTKFANITALTNGINICIMNVDGTVKKQITNIKRNFDIANIASVYNVMAGAAEGGIMALINLKQDYGDEIEVDGTAGEYVEFLVQDATTGTGSIYFVISGKLSA